MHPKLIYFVAALTAMLSSFAQARETSIPGKYVSETAVGLRVPALYLLPDSLSFYDSTSSGRRSSEFGRALEVIDDGLVRVIDTPLFAPNHEFEHFANGRLICSAKQDAAAFNIKCQFPSGKTLLSRYVPTNGVEWFDYFCTPWSSDVCRYNFKSGKRFFSP